MVEVLLFCILVMLVLIWRALRVLALNQFQQMNQAYILFERGLKEREDG